MSAGIETYDKIVATEKCWHNLETIVPEINLENSGLNWNVAKKPLFLDMDHAAIEGWSAVVREDLGLALNVPKSSYEIIQNARVWEALETSLAGVNYRVTCAGSLYNCRKIFISIELLDKQEYVVNRDKFKANLTFVSSHDGTLAFSAYDCMTRVVCHNTLTMSLMEKGLIDCKVFHSKGAELKIKNMEQSIDAIFEKREEWLTSYEYLASRPMSMELANKVLTGFVANGEELSTRSKNTIGSITSLFLDGKGNNGETYADLLNGVTEYYTHFNNKKSVFNNFQSSEFGTAAQKKAEFFDILMNDSELDKLAKRGEKLLEIAV